MKFTNAKGHILISEISQDELFAFLKFQVQSKIIFVNKNNQRIDEDIVLINRDFINGERFIEIDYNGSSDMLSYGDLYSLINSILSAGNVLNIMVPINTFKLKEPLIMMMNSVNDSVINDCVYIDYYDNIFEIKSPDLKNGDSNKIFYFELNDTILGFNEKGPKLVTDNPGINSIDDVIGN